MPIDFSKEIDTVEDISYADFQENYMKPQRPLKFKNLMRYSEAYDKWSPDFFKEKLGHIEVGVFDNDNAHLDRSYKQAPHTMKFGDYLDKIQEGPTDARLHLFNVFKHMPELKDHFEYPKHMVKNIITALPFAFFGGEGSVARIHRDMDNANVFLTEFWGKKFIAVFDPKYDELLYRYPFTTHTAIDIENPDYDKYPGLHHVVGEHTILDRGETLFMPCKYWHYIRYMSPGIGMAFRSLGPIPTMMQGWWQAGVISTFDDSMRKATGKWWFEKKTELAQEKADRILRSISSKSGRRQGNAA